MFHVEHSGIAPLWQNVSRGTVLRVWRWRGESLFHVEQRTPTGFPGAGFHPTNLAFECPPPLSKSKKSQSSLRRKPIALCWGRSVRSQNSVPRGTIRSPKPDFHGQSSVPRETSCILGIALLNFRSGETVGSNHRGCEPKGWSWQDNHGGEFSRLSCHG